MSFSIRLPEALDARLTALAKTTGRAKSYYVREALEATIEDMELIYNLDQQLTDIRSGKTKTVSHADLMKELGFDA